MLDRTVHDVMDTFKAAVQVRPEILEAHLVAGGFDYLLKTRVSDMAAYRQFIGEGVTRLFQQALPPPAVTQDEVAGCVAGFHEVYGEHWNDTTCPYPGICDLLDELSRRGIQLAVLSNKPDEFTRLCVAEHFGRWHDIS